MHINRKISALACAAIMCLSTAACSKSEDNPSSAASTSSKRETVTKSEKVELKSYGFPEFLNDIEKPDMLSKELYRSFDESEFVKAVEKQPFEDYECESCIGELVYTFRSGGYVGLLDLSGNEIISADKYASITAVSSGILVLSGNKEQNIPDDYARLYNNGKVVMLDTFLFDPSQITVGSFEKYTEDPTDSNGDKKKYFTVRLPDGTFAATSDGNTEWDSADAVSAEELDTDKTFSACWKVSRGNAFYYLCFDDYYNYTVYSGAYALVRLKVGNVYGECYILDNDDYSELNKMVTSFGDIGQVKAPTKDDNLDFIQILFGLNAADQVQITVSSDGYCLTDCLTQNEQPMNKYFSCLDKESFVSLVLWVDQVLSQEY